MCEMLALRALTRTGMRDDGRDLSVLPKSKGIEVAPIVIGGRGAELDRALPPPAFRSLMWIEDGRRRRDIVRMEEGGLEALVARRGEMVAGQGTGCRDDLRPGTRR